MNNKKTKKVDYLVKRAFDIRQKTEAIIHPKRNPIEAQKKQLKKLLLKAELTTIGTDCNFSQILKSSNLVEEFQKNVPIFDYSSMYHKYWNRQLKGESSVTWPGKTKYFALSSGTSEAASKYIPITSDILKSIKKSQIRLLLTITQYQDVPSDFYKKGSLLIGGSTELQYNGTNYEGDLSGITAKTIPFWFQKYYKPGKKISKLNDWDYKLKEIVKNAPKWDIVLIAGVPAWIQIVLEKIIEEYKLNNIHDLWPDLTFFIHSGVSIAPYVKSFEKIFGKPVHYRESYFASEGFIASAIDPKNAEMTMLYEGGNFYEFIPFNEQNFSPEGNLLPSAKAIWVDQVQENENYAILLSTNGGSWRYLIGDTIMFTNIAKHEIKITGRTKHYLSVAGEHLSLDNMSRAIELTQDELNIIINEFTVFAERHHSMFAHHWYIGSDQIIDNKVVSQCIDKHLATLNDDYRVERLEAIRDVMVDIIPEKAFYQYMEWKGKLGSANKFPRVLKGDRIDEWKAFLKEREFSK